MKPMETISIFDVETAPLPDEKLDAIKPVFKAPSNYKKEDVITANILEQEQAWRERAALDATTGRVLCIGMLSSMATIDVTQADDEAAVIERFWNWLELRLQRSEKVVGFCIFNFDLCFLTRRSWALNIDVPPCVRKGRYWHEDLIDLADVWKMGNYDQRISLDTLAKTLGLGAKTGSGADFAKLWAEDRKAALEYVSNDLTLTRLCAERMLGIKPTKEFPHLKPTTTKLVVPTNFDVMP